MLMALPSAWLCINATPPRPKTVPKPAPKCCNLVPWVLAQVHDLVDVIQSDFTNGMHSNFVGHIDLLVSRVDNIQLMCQALDATQVVRFI